MKNIVCKIGAGLVISLFLVSTISAADVRSLDFWDEKAREKYNNAKAEYQKTTEAYDSARQDWLKARNKYRLYKSAENLTDALNKAIKHLLEANKRLVAYIKMVIAYVEGKPGLEDAEREAILNELNSFVTWLEGHQDEIEQATRKDELVNLAKSVRDKWQEIKQAAKRIAGQMINVKVGWLISQAEKVSARIEKVIQKLEERGEDVTALKTWLEDFDEKVELAKQKYEAAKEKYAEAKNLKDADRLIQEGKAFVTEAKRYLKSAYRTLKEIVKELKRYKTGEVTLRGTGTLIAEGDGSAYIAGSGKVDLSGENGTLIVTDVSGDMTINVTGFGNKTELEPNKWQYTGTGSANMAGSDIVVEIEGKNIYLTAEGSGSATLKGTGSYTIYKRRPGATPVCISKNWTTEGITVTLSVGG
jgi:HAMP domain-containing protein